MIIEAVFGWMCQLAVWFASVFPTIAPPADASENLAPWASTAGVLIDIPALSAAMVWIIGCETLLFGVRLLILARHEMGILSKGSVG